MNHENGTILVAGGAGKTGGRVAERLRQSGRSVRVASRSTHPTLDWNDPETFAGVVEGVEAIYIAYSPDLALPGAAESIGALARLAVRAGARRIVLLSGRGEPQVLASEQAVRESGARTTILRSAWFAQNFSEGHLAEPVQQGELAFPAGSVAEPFVDAEDIADVAVAALTDDRHADAIYELTGPRLLTFAQAMAEVSSAAGRSIRYRHVTQQEYAEMLAPYLPPEVIRFMNDLFEQVLDGHNAYLSDGVERALGRAPRDFSAYARRTAETGVWAAPK